MKRLCAILAVAIMCMGICACSDVNNSIKETSVPTSTSVPNENPTEAPTEEPETINYTEKTIECDTLFANSKVQGRTVVTDYVISKSKGNGRGIALDYTASSIEFNAYCEGKVSVSLFVNPTYSGGTKLFFNVYVDGVKVTEDRSVYSTNGKKFAEFALAENLERGLHSFMIERQPEAERGYIYVNSVTLSGELAEKPKNNDLLIEIIGDSITCGYGNLWPNNAGGVNATEAHYNEYEDGTRSFAVLAAKKVGADYSVVAQQGIGCVKGLLAHTMLETYTKQCYQCGRTEEWAFERKADIVVIALGTNDNAQYGTGALSLANMTEGFKQFISLVKEKNPDAKIIWAYGMMGESYATANAIKAALNSFGGESKGLFYISMTENFDGGNTHPSLAAHITNGNKLADKINEIIGK